MNALNTATTEADWRSLAGWRHKPVGGRNRNRQEDQGKDKVVAKGKHKANSRDKGKHSKNKAKGTPTGNIVVAEAQTPEVEVITSAPRDPRQAAVQALEDQLLEAMAELPQAERLLGPLSRGCFTTSDQLEAALATLRARQQGQGWKVRSPARQQGQGWRVGSCEPARLPDVFCTQSLGIPTSWDLDRVDPPRVESETPATADGGIRIAVPGDLGLDGQSLLDLLAGSTSVGESGA